MNKEYIYIDGKVVISDENGNKTQSEYYDNLDEVLIQENVIETMEKQIKELERKSESYNNKKHYIPYMFPTISIMSIFGSPFLYNLMTNYAGCNAFETLKNTFLGPMSEAMVVSIAMSACFIPAGAFVELSMYQNYKGYMKRGIGIKSELDFLKEEIVKEKEELEILKQNKSRENECTTFRT